MTERVKIDNSNEYSSLIVASAAVGGFLAGCFLFKHLSSKKDASARVPVEHLNTKLYQGENKLKPGNKVGEVFDIHAKTFDKLGYSKSRMNACGYSLGATFSPNWMDWPMLYTGNPYIIEPGNVFFMHMILMDSENGLAMNLGETYLVTENGNERLGKQKLDLVVL